MTISHEFKEAIKEDSVKCRLAPEIGISYSSLIRWITKDNSKFATLPVLAAIERITGLKQDQVFEPEPETETEKATATA